MLNGSIPEAFNDLHGLSIVNISFNQLEGRIPDLKAFHEASFDALRNNKGLCGNATGLWPCILLSQDNHGHGRRTKVILLAMLPLFGGLLLLFILAASFLACCKKTPTRKSEPWEEPLGDIFRGYGTVYKAALPTGQASAMANKGATMEQVAQALSCQTVPLPSHFSTIKLGEVMDHVLCKG
ncbi:hypothetical protein V6N13_037979 [Hibiscus sabdariffa]